MTDPAKAAPKREHVTQAGTYMGAIRKGDAFILNLGVPDVEEIVRIADVQPQDDACCKVRVAGTSFWQPEFEFRKIATPLVLAHTARPDAGEVGRDDIGIVLAWAINGASSYGTGLLRPIIEKLCRDALARPAAGDEDVVRVADRILARVEAFLGRQGGFTDWAERASVKATGGWPKLRRVIQRAALAAMREGVKPNPQFEQAWRAYNDELSWMQDNPQMKAYWGWNLAAIANDLIDRAYPGLRAGKTPEGVDRGMVQVPHEPTEAMLKAAKDAGNDYAFGDHITWDEIPVMWRAMVKAAAVAG